MSRISKYTTEQIQKVIKESIEQAIKEGIREPINLHIDKEGFRKIIEECISDPTFKNIIDLNARIKKLEQEVEKRDKEIGRLLEDNTRLLKERDEARHKVNEITSEKEKLCKSLDYSSALGMERLTELVKLKEDNARTKELEQERDKIKADYEHVCRRLNVCEEYKDKYKEANERFRQENEEIKKRLSKIRDCFPAGTWVHVISQDILDICNGEDTPETIKRATEVTMEDTTDSLRKQVSRLKTATFGLNQDNSCLKAENEKFRKECADLVLSKREEIEKGERLENKIAKIKTILGNCGFLNNYDCHPTFTHILRHIYEICDE